MAQAARRKARQAAGDVPEATPLLERSARKTEKGRNQHPEGRMSTRRFQPQPPLEKQTTLRLRFRQAYFDPGPEEDWWTSLSTTNPDGEGRGHKQLKENTDKEQARLGWMQRLRPKPHRRLS
ncbi:uncharacterized protein N7446_007915 [Penicillium canescens]|uniref:uncharacterized protein n=1 Tax=Penicillium canescens TaxID=5083 RepID=UPI0026E10377|nr:uncharacterized protein N7446_007868 [Penicillium canescens]XP_058370306.1 uncharacterized protein N7446_007915 [Penicillium canescens]KAJ6033840.1 hypothetical protein N7444_011611 [Penicillium canescens]KAJ6058285.1 hypothetical protein N7446_007868 [Penicillium canescens]KAJ6058332.1 hypothetical protein N7446_007915 [Penicillium canescens]